MYLFKHNTVFSANVRGAVRKDREMLSERPPTPGGRQSESDQACWHGRVIGRESNTSKPTDVTSRHIVNSRVRKLRVARGE
ncbi:hypothetical protein J6590_070168 [Homalodisca vitripennis]|nr:hypothetical protein J6590_070168 [Homalodisca vitripennis]